MKRCAFALLGLCLAVGVALGARWPLGQNPTVSPPRLTDPFGPRLRSSGAYDFHMGLDIGAPQGTPIHAPFDGYVEDTRELPGYGHTVWISHGGTYDSFYAHLNDVGHAIGSVEEGEIIGEVGNSGGPYGFHLHFGRYDSLLSYPWPGGNRIWVHPAHDLPFYNAHPDSGPHDIDSSYFADSEALLANGVSGLEARFDLHVPARSFSFLSLRIHIFDTFELIAEYSLEDFLQYYDYDSTPPPSGWEELQTVALHATTIEDNRPPGTVTFYPEFYQSSHWPNPAHQTIEFIFVWPEVDSRTRAAVENGTALWSVEVGAPNYGTQAYFEWSTASAEYARWEGTPVSLYCESWPNPFNAAAQIAYYLPRNSPVSIAFFDVLGRRVHMMRFPMQSAGWHRTRWQTDHLPSGTYFVRLEAAGEATTQRLQLVR
jgi:hypothetical protein